MTIPESVNAALLVIAAFVSVLFIPPITSLLTARNAAGWVKQLVATVLSLIEAVGAVAVAGALDLTNFSATALTVMLASKASYEWVFKDISEKAHDAGPQLGAKPDATGTSS